MKGNKRILFLLPVLAIAAWLSIFGDKTPVGTANSDGRSGGGNVADTQSGDLIGRPPEQAGATTAPVPVRASVRVALEQSAPANLFAGEAPPPPPPQAESKTEPEVPPPNFTYIGSRTDNGRLTVFLDKDNQTYIATPGAMLGDFRVEAVQSNQIQLTHVPTKTTHIIPIEGDK